MTDRNIKRVAVIGAGISGVVSAGHLLAAGLEVTVFERSKAAGGNWLYDKRVPIEAVYPSIHPSDAIKFGRDGREGNERKELIHAPPGPCYEGLTNNVSTPLLKTTLNSWPKDTPPYVTHDVLLNYIQDTSKTAGVDAATIYGALVTKVYKEGSEWHVTWTTLHEDPETGNLTEKSESAIFDAVVVASGHYHVPLVPDIKGLAEAKAKWPTVITHSKSFRNSEGFSDKNVLLIGGGVSSLDIAKEISSKARTVHQSTRNGYFDISAAALPEKTKRIEEVIEFEITENASGEHLPLIAHLKSGGTLENIDRVVLATGYQLVLPFLPQYNDETLTRISTDESVIISDGTQVHNLHRDIFYIPDPTLAFVGIPFYTATFSLFEFQAIAVTAFLSGAINLPSVDEQRAEYQEKIKTKGYGRSFHSLKGEEEGYVIDLLDWVNKERALQNLPPIEGHTAVWLEAKKAQIEHLKVLFPDIYGAVEVAASA
ncbi:hypothetical protein N7495_006528 [Penicillium taxi]|uniref:uncharacterized protein n=1 Tax=Penicillium taxi TaxID=168475 RepID=UPI002545AACC|nr:uncharacterized protein N7495_006528 [Penicillium taxi]KAJ5894837.1 hypothetical protein N7495_006528 [Penicillium taxi]